MDSFSIFVLILMCFGVQIYSASICSRSTSKLQGFFPPAFTPVDSCGHLNLSAVEEYAAHLKYHGVNGVLLAGTNGEGPTLDMHDRMKLLDAWMVEARHLGLTVIMHVGGLVFSDVLELAKYSVTAGADAVLTLPELYYKPSEVDQLVTYVAQVGNAAWPLPVLYYDIPQMTGVNLNMAEFFQKATDRIPNFAGLKCTLEVAFQVTASNILNENQTIIVATDTGIASAYQQCLNGTVSGAASLFPELVVQIRDAALSGDEKRAKSLQLELSRIMAAITAYNDESDDSGKMIAYLKAAMKIVTGISVGPTRDPLKKTSLRERRQIAKNLQYLGVYTVMHE